MIYSPVVLSSVVSIPAGQQRQPDLRALQHPFQRAMYIDEIRFWIDTPASITLRVLTRSLGGSVRASFSLGRTALTTLEVPIWNFDTATSFAYSETPEVNRSFATKNKAYYRWRLPKPLLLPPGSILAPTLSRQLNDGWSDDSTNALPVTITYLGRALPQGAPLPREVPVPYVGVWIDDSGGTAQVESGDLELVNPFTAPLHIDRFVGRIRRFLDSGTDSLDFEDDFAVSTDFTVRMRDSSGRDLIRDLLPFNEVFDQQTRSWRCPFVLAPKERIIASISGKIVTSLRTYEPMISMVGYRYEVL